jgi:hypothetical protein
MTTEANVTVVTEEVVERTTSLLTGTITRDDGVTGFKPSTLLLTLYDKNTGTVINSRSASDVLSSVDASGALALQLHPLDNVILDATRNTEKHRALLYWTWGSGEAGAHTFEFTVRNHTKLP